MSKQIYISGALTNSSRKQFYENLGEVVEQSGYKPYIPHLHTDPEKNAAAKPCEVYEVDMRQIDNSCLVIAYVGYPSLGVGAELEHANTKGIPMILLYEKGEKVSRLALGIPMVKRILEFADEETALKYVSQYLQNMENS